MNRHFSKKKKKIFKWSTDTGETFNITNHQGIAN